MNKIAIIGGGASGLVAAIVALRENCRVDIFEKNIKIGKKILISGNGRCNITNKNIHAKHYFVDNENFLKHALKNFDAVKFFESLGIYMYENENGRCYPKSNQASSVVEAFEYEILRLSGVIHLDSCVEKITKKDDKFILHVNGKIYKYDKICLCCGSDAMMKIKGNSYELALSLNHSIKPLLASLVQLQTIENTSLASGVKIKCHVSIKVENKELKCVSDDVLFTPYGISGSGILDISRYASFGLFEGKKVQVVIDCMKDISKQKLQQFLSAKTNKSIDLHLNGLINKKLAQFILSISKIDTDQKVQNLDKKSINTLVYNLKNLTLNINFTRGIKSAEVVAGGVCIDEICENSMESKIVNNLFFGGEIIDVDGVCGGYNLHWAFASGYLAGKNIVKM